MLRLLKWLIILALSLGILSVAANAVHRINSFTVFTEGKGTPINSPSEAFRMAEWNIPYITGLAIGVLTGIGLSIIAGSVLRSLWLRLYKAPIVSLHEPQLAPYDDDRDLTAG